MPLSKERNKERMRKFRATSVQPNAEKPVQPKLVQRLVAAGLRIEGNKISLGSKQAVAQPDLPIYNPTIHRPGDKVLVKVGGRLVPMIVPVLDGDGRPMPW
jgi:hypothetical protein